MLSLLAACQVHPSLEVVSLQALLDAAYDKIRQLEQALLAKCKDVDADVEVCRPTYPHCTLLAVLMLKCAHCFVFEQEHAGFALDPELPQYTLQFQHVCCVFSCSRQHRPTC